MDVILTLIVATIQERVIFKASEIIKEEAILMEEEITKVEYNLKIEVKAEAKESLQEEEET